MTDFQKSDSTPKIVQELRTKSSESYTFQPITFFSIYRPKLKQIQPEPTRPNPWPTSTHIGLCTIILRLGVHIKALNNFPTYSCVFSSATGEILLKYVTRRERSGQVIFGSSGGK